MTVFSEKIQVMIRRAPLLQVIQCSVLDYLKQAIKKVIELENTKEIGKVLEITWELFSANLYR